MTTLTTATTTGNSQLNPISSGGGSLQSIVSSCVFDLDATQEASYGGSGTTWVNLVAAPADSEVQTAYDATLGDGVTAGLMPTFTGTAGDSGAYWLFDGTDYFKMDGTLTTFMQNLPVRPAGQDFTLVMTYKWVDAFGCLFSTGSNSTANPGLTIFNKNSSTVRLRALMHPNSGGSTVVDIGNEAISAGDDVCLIYKREGDAITIQLKGFSNTGALSTNSTAGLQMPAISGYAASPTTLEMPNTTRIYSCAMFNEALSAEDIAAVKTELGSRHGRTYT